MEMAKISKNSKFYISPEEMVAKFPEEMVAKFKDRRNINILCFNRIMTLMLEYPNRASHNCINYYFSAIFKDVVKMSSGLLLCTYKFGFKNKKGEIIVKNFCFTNKDEEYSALEKAIEWYATNLDSQLDNSFFDNSFYKIMIKDESGEGSTYNTTTMKVLAREDYVNQVSEVYSAIEREKC